MNISSADTITLSGQIQNSSGAIALTKNGPGTAIFSKPQSYTGGTTVNGGILELATDSGGLKSNVTVNPNAALRSNGATIFGNATIMPGGTYQPNGATTEVIGNLVLDTGGNLSLRLGSQGNQDEETVGGNLKLAGKKAVPLFQDECVVPSVQFVVAASQVPLPPFTPPPVVHTTRLDPGQRAGRGMARWSLWI